MEGSSSRNISVVIVCDLKEEREDTRKLGVTKVKKPPDKIEAMEEREVAHRKVYPEPEEEIDYGDMDINKWGSLGNKKSFKKKKRKKKKSRSG
jgi:hypothetical protein